MFNLIFLKNGKKIFKMIIVSIVIFVFLLIVIEFSVKLLRPDIILFGIDKKFFVDKRFGNSYGHKPNFKSVIFGETVITDEFGFRLDPTSKSPLKNSSNILILGDSISFGIGVKVEKRFSSLLEKKLSNHRIINSSTIGYKINDYYNITKFLLSNNNDFEGIIVCLCLDDFSSASQLYIRAYLSDKAKAKLLAPNRWKRLFISLNYKLFDFNAFLRNCSKAYILLRNLIFDSGKIFFNAVRLDYINQENENYIRERIMRIKNLAFEKGKWIIFCIFPFEYQLRQVVSKDIERETLLPQRLINKIAQENKIAIIDLYPAMVKKIKDSHLNSKELYLTYDPMHFSEKGHLIISEILYEELEKRQML